MWIADGKWNVVSILTRGDSDRTCGVRITEEVIQTIQRWSVDSPAILDFTIKLKNVPSDNQGSSIAVTLNDPIANELVWGPVHITTDQWGNYSNLMLSGIGSGIYDVCVKPKIHLGQCISNVAITPGTETYLDFSYSGSQPAWPGDVDGFGGDNVVNSVDSATFRNEFQRCLPFTACNQNHPFDFNRDGVLNLNDYSMLLGTWGNNPRGNGDFVPSAVHSADTTHSSVSPSELALAAGSSYNVGDEFDLSVYIAAYEETHGADVVIDFDPGVLAVQNVEVKDDIYSTVGENRVDTDKGLIYLVLGQISGTMLQNQA